MFPHIIYTLLVYLLLIQQLGWIYWGPMFMCLFLSSLLHLLVIVTKKAFCWGFYLNKQIDFCWLEMLYIWQHVISYNDNYNFA